MAKTIEQLKAQSAEVKNATVVGENTATRVGTLFTDIVEHVEGYETEQTADTKANAQAIEAEKNRAEAAEQAIIYDVSARNGGMVFESLSALLSSDDLSTLIPTSVRRGGMTIRFIQGSGQGSDNKYVQYRLMSDSFNTTVDNWQGVDDEPTIISKNLVLSGGLFNSISGRICELDRRVGANPAANTLSNGVYFYNYTTKKIYYVKDTTIPQYVEVPFKNGGIYTYEGSFYRWDGNNLVLDSILSNLYSNSTQVYIQGPSKPTIKKSLYKYTVIMPTGVALRFYNLREGTFKVISLNGETYVIDSAKALVCDLSDNTLKVVNPDIAGDYIVLLWNTGFSAIGFLSQYYYQNYTDSINKNTYSAYFQSEAKPTFIRQGVYMNIIMPNSVLRLYDNAASYDIDYVATVNGEIYKIQAPSKLVFDLDAAQNADKIKVVTATAAGNYVELARWNGTRIEGLLSPYFELSSPDEVDKSYDDLLISNNNIANKKSAESMLLESQLINAVIGQSDYYAINSRAIIFDGKVVATQHPELFEKLKFRVYEKDVNNTILVRNDVDGNKNVIYLNESTVSVGVGILFTTGTISTAYLEELLYKWNIFEGDTIALNKIVKPYELPSYWETYMLEKSKTLKNKLREVGNHGDAFCFITDIHVPFNYMHSPYLAKYILQHTRIDKIFNGGDYIQQQDSNALAVQTMDKWFDLYSYGNPILIRGNHDTNVYGTEFVDDDDFYGSATKYAEKECNTNKKLYFHLDNESQKIRYIFLDTGDELTDGYNFAGSGANNEAFRQAQLDYLTARCTELSSDWTVVVVCHIFFTGQGTGAEREIIISPIGEYIKNTIDGFYDTMIATFAGIISGHIHRDFGVVTTKGYVAIATTCDANDVLASAYDLDNPNRTEGTITEQAFDVYYIDTLSKKIMTIRIGAGNISSDREFSYA